MKKILFFIAALVALGVAYWLISPAFIDKEVNESLSPLQEILVDEMEKKMEFGGKALRLSQQVEEEMITEFLDEMKEMNEKRVDTMDETSPVDNEAGVAAVKTGSFQDVAHHGSGMVSLIRYDAGHIIRFENLDVLNGPDLRVLLSRNSDVGSSDDLGEYLELGKLKGNKGNQNYTVPAGTDLSEYNSVIIYCKPFRVVFNSANLN